MIFENLVGKFSSYNLNTGQMTLLDTIRRLFDRDRRTRSLNESFTSTNSSVSRLGIKDILKFISSLLLPLTLGVFTIVVTFQQQSVAQQQRSEDRITAELQRQLDKNLTEEKYKNEVFDNYIKEIGELLQKKNGSLTLDRVTAILARVKTLNVLRQLDEQRNIRIIQFLYEAQQLSDGISNQPLDLSTAHLSDFDFRQLAVDEVYLSKLSLVGLILSNATFANVDLEQINFLNIQLRWTSFSLGYLRTVNFAHGKLRNVTFSLNSFQNSSVYRGNVKDCNFSSCQIRTVDFSSATLENVTFSFNMLNKVKFSSVQLHQTTFSQSTLNNVNFSLSDMSNVRYLSGHLQNTFFSLAKMVDVHFSNVRIQKIDFFRANIKSTTFYFSAVFDAEFLETQLFNVKYFSVDVYRVNFSSAGLTFCQFSNCEISDTEFINADISIEILCENRFFVQNLFSVSTDFSHSKMPHAKFERTDIIGCNFTNASLIFAKFLGCNMKFSIFTGADLNGVDFSGSNLYRVNFLHTKITEEQLSKALSVHEAVLPNGNLVYDANMLYFGPTDCEITFNSSWILLDDGNVTGSISNKNRNSCRFTVSSTSSRIRLLRRVNLSNKWIWNQWPASRIIFSAEMSSDVYIELRGIDANEFLSEQSILNSNQQNISLVLRQEIQKLEIIINFQPSTMNQRRSLLWCDDIMLFIIYDTYLDYRPDIPKIPDNAKWEQKGTTVAGINGYGSDITQLSLPHGLFIDDNEKLLIADHLNHRVLEWSSSEIMGRIVFGGEGLGNKLNQLYQPTDIVLDRVTDSYIVCDSGNRRVLRWSRQTAVDRVGEILVNDIDCWGLAIDSESYLYVSDDQNNQVKRFSMDNLNTNGIIVAGGNGRGSNLDQLSDAGYIFVDEKQSVYVSDYGNHRVMKWIKGAKKGAIVAGGQGKGDRIDQLSGPMGLMVDTAGILYVAEEGNNRITSWSPLTNQSIILIGDAAEFSSPVDLSFDQNNNLYVSDRDNHRIQRFSIE